MARGIETGISEVRNSDWGYLIAFAAPERRMTELERVYCGNDWNG